MRALPFALLALLPLPALAQEAPVVGTILTAKAPTVLYDRPPNSVFGEAAAPTAVVREGDQGAEVFRVAPDAANPGSYAVVPDAPVSAEGLRVIGSVEVYQGDRLQQWIQVAPAGNGPEDGMNGWTAYNPENLTTEIGGM